MVVVFAEPSEMHLEPWLVIKTYPAHQGLNGACPRAHTSENARSPEESTVHCFEIFSLKSNILNLGVKAVFSGPTPISPFISFFMATDGVKLMRSEGRGQGRSKSSGKTRKRTR